MPTPNVITTGTAPEQHGLALTRGDASWTAQALSGQASRLAGRLSAAGVRAGDILLSPAADEVELLLLQRAVARLGAGLLPYAADLSEGAIAALAECVGAEWRRGSEGLAPLAAVREPEAGQRSEIARPTLLIRTSGSSGEPRVVMLTREQLLASAERVNRALGLGAGDQWLCPLPLHHIGGMAIAWRCALAGSIMRLLCPLGSDCGAPLDKRTSTGSGFDADLVARTLASYPVTHLSLVPPMLQRLLDVMPRPPDALRVLLLGGQALHPALARRAADAGWPLFVSYGMSETGSMVAVGRWRDDSTPGTRIGPLLPDVDIASPPPSAAAAQRGGVGADLRTGPLRLRGPMLMVGYGNPRRRPGAGLEAGWLSTADLGRLDTDGTLRIFGRADDVLVIGGEQVHPAAVEARLAEAPGIGEVAVLGVPHPTWGATLAACWSGPISARELERWCRDRLPSRQRPRVLRRIEALPRLASGKLDRAALGRTATAAGEDVVGF